MAMGSLDAEKILRRKNRPLPSYDCVLCQHPDLETVEHLFLRCPFAVLCWDIFHLVLPTGDPFEVLECFRLQLNSNFFMDIIIIMSWCIGMERNDLIFTNFQPNLNSVRQRFKIEFALVILREKEHKKDPMHQRLHSTL